jgi:hypothetical protein
LVSALAAKERAVFDSQKIILFAAFRTLRQFAEPSKIERLAPELNVTSYVERG